MRRRQLAPPQPQNNDDLFGPANGSRPPTQGWPAVRHWIRSDVGRDARTRPLGRRSGGCRLRAAARRRGQCARRACELAISQDALQAAGAETPSGDGNSNPRFCMPVARS